MGILRFLSPCILLVNFCSGQNANFIQNQWTPEAGWHNVNDLEAQESNNDHRIRLVLYLGKDENQEISGPNTKTRLTLRDSHVSSISNHLASSEENVISQHRRNHRRKFRRPKRFRHPSRNSPRQDGSFCEGTCSNMLSCMLHGGRSSRNSHSICGGFMQVCCVSWRNHRNLRHKQFRPPRFTPPKKSGRALPDFPQPLAAPTFDSISYSGLAPFVHELPHHLAATIVTPPSENDLYHSNFVEDVSNFDCGQSRNANRRIMGGLDAGYGQFPWTAHIKIKGPDIDKECGGTLINSRWILTAGHCTQYCLSVLTCAAEIPQHEITYKVILGEYDQLSPEEFPSDSYFAIDVIRHPLYRNIMRYHENGFVESEPRYDIAMLMLDREVKLAPNVAPICLPSPEFYDLSSATHGTVVGWGRMGRHEGDPHSSVLQAATVPVLTDEQCLKQTGLQNFDDQLCAGESGSLTSACPGDSGGALQVQNKSGRWMLIGIVSNGPSTCGLQPVVFHKVAKTLHWINNVVEKEELERRQFVP